MAGTMREIEVSGQARELAARPYTISTVYDWVDGYYVSRAEEWPYLAGAEETPEAAEATLRDAIAIAIAGNLHRHLPVPEPRHSIT